jgi:hypothetical protein
MSERVAYLCPSCGTDTYNTPTGWLHYSTDTEQCHVLTGQQKGCRVVNMNTWTPWASGPANKNDRVRFSALNRIAQMAASYRAQELYEGNPLRQPGTRLTVARCWRESLDYVESQRTGATR